jgi:hypothetical protein
VPGTFGQDLPGIRDWTEDHYDFTGYITGFAPAAIADRDRLRASSATGRTSRCAS